MINRFDQEYLNLCKKILDEGYWEYNERTKKKCLKIHGHMMKFDLSDGKFPLLTLRKMYTKGMVGELVGFIRGFDNAAQFRSLGCNFWDANANASSHWLANKNRKGLDDLGRVYGVQARRWHSYVDIGSEEGELIQHKQFAQVSIDQLKQVVDKLSNGIDDRRLIVTHLNPGELDQMALPPCHMMYQFGLRGDMLDMCMYQRSADMPLGVPTNIASYALFLNLIAQITNKTPGVFTHFLWNTHFYEDQMDGMQELLKRDGFEAPRLKINPNIKSLEDLETWVMPEDIQIEEYVSGEKITFPFSE